MSPSLATCILLIVHLFSSAAPLTQTMKKETELNIVMVPEELAPVRSLIDPPSKYPLTTLNSSIATLATLTGYVLRVSYSDSLCTTLIYASVLVLNTCFEDDDDVYVMVTATSSSVRSVKYTDSLCTLNGIATSRTYKDGACDNYSKTFISSTSTLTTAVATTSQR